MKNYLKEAYDALGVKVEFHNGQPVVKLSDAQCVAEILDTKWKGYFEVEIDKRVKSKMKDVMDGQKLSNRRDGNY